MRKSVPIVFAANMSVGVVVLLSLVEQAAAKLGPGYDVEIVEMHHRHKVDAPSGTALQLGEAAAAGAGPQARGLRACTRAKATPASARRERSDSRRCGAATSSASTRWSSRAPASASSSSHRATSRQNFAGGALRAARIRRRQARAAGQSGLFDMRDVLGL